MCMVVLPSGVMVNQMAGVYAAVPMAASALLPASNSGNAILKKPLPAITVERTRKSRRVMDVLLSGMLDWSIIGSAMIAALLHHVRGAMYCTDDAGIGGAAAQVAVHVRYDFLAGWIGIDSKQRSRL